MPLSSMTGFADRAGAEGGFAWTWEARSVNSRSLDIRLRLPEGAAEALELPLRQALSAALARGAVSVSLRIGRGAPGAARLSAEGLAAALAAAGAAQEAAGRQGITLAPMSLGELLSIRGVLETEAEPGVSLPAVQAALRADIEPLVAGLVAARRAEGAALAAHVAARLEAMTELVHAARQAAEARAARSGELLRARVEALLGAAQEADPARLAQELALIAVRCDVSEELDRLEAHIEAAQSLIAQDAPAGRKLDFLMQEFNREANTLCAKAQSSALTALGLEMKVAIDQMREQVQNVE